MWWICKKSVLPLLLTPRCVDVSIYILNETMPFYLLIIIIDLDCNYCS